MKKAHNNLLFNIILLCYCKHRQVLYFSVSAIISVTTYIIIEATILNFNQIRHHTDYSTCRVKNYINLYIIDYSNIHVCRDISQLSSAGEERLHGSLDST